MSTSTVQTISMFNAATTGAHYRAAKRHAARLPLAEQFVVVDSIIAARRRLEAGGISVTR